MICAELTAPKRIEIAVRPMVTDPGPGEVLVRLEAVGVCGSDLHWFLDGRVGYTAAQFPIVLGHEPFGEVAAIGPGVDTHRVGQKVAIEPSVVCGTCEYCKGGRPNNCVASRFMGGNQLPGFFREFAVVPAPNAELLPEGFGWREGVLVEPVAVVVHVFELVDLRPGDTVAVIGAGPIGILTAVEARRRGAGRVILTDRVAHRVEMARRLGAGEAVCASARDFVPAVMDLTAGRGADVVFDAAGSPETVQAGIEVTRPSGQYVLIGIPSETMFGVDLHTAMMKELRIQTVKRSNQKGHEAMERIARGEVPLELITHTMGLERTQEAFDLAVNCRDNAGKVVVISGSASG